MGSWRQGIFSGSGYTHCTVRECVCVCMGSTSEELCWLWLTSWALPVPMVPIPAGGAASRAPSLLTHPESLRAKGHQDVPPGDGALLSCTHQGFDSWAKIPPDLGRLFKPTMLTAEDKLCVHTERAAAFTLSSLLQVLQQRCTRLIFVNSPSQAC